VTVRFRDRRVTYRIVQCDECLIYYLDMRPRPRKSSRLPSPTRSWLRSDLLFLRLSLGSGMPVAEVAAFLTRDEEEVQEKAEELRRSA
jgi:hypothetical protein